MHHPRNVGELLCGRARLEILKCFFKKNKLWNQLSGVTVSRFNFTGINVHDHQKKKKKNLTVHTPHYQPSKVRPLHDVQAALSLSSQALQL